MTRATKICPVCGRVFGADRPASQLKRQHACSRNCSMILRHQNGEKLGKVILPIADRFWPKVKKTEGCWIWIASLNSAGYGNFNTATGEGRAHRVSWELHFGPIPPGRHVLHRCDNPPCVNPSHLFLGDQAANVADMVSKGRARNARLNGETNPNAKLTRADILLIRNDPRSHGSIASDYGITRGSISRIKRGERWRHLDG